MCLAPLRPLHLYTRITEIHLNFLIYPRLDVLIVRGGKLVRSANANAAEENVPPQRAIDPSDLSVANTNRPQRQCTTRSLSYKFVEQNSEDED